MLENFIKLDKILNAFIKKNTLINSEYISVYNNWQNIFETEITQHIAPIKSIKQGKSNILVIKCNKISALELQHNSSNILDKINHFLGKKHFNNIKIINM